MNTRLATAREDAPDTDGATTSLRLWLQLMKCARAIEAEVGGRFRRTFDQSLARFDLLSQLYRMDGRRASVGALADNMMAASGNITALIDRMEAEGLVARRASPTDRRSNEISMTADGLRLFRRMARAHARWMDEALGPVRAADKEALIVLLRQVRQTVEDGVAASHKDRP